MDLINNEYNNKNYINKVKSKYIVQQIFNNLSKIKLLEIIRYNKQLQNKLDIRIIDYIRNFSKIIIEIIPEDNHYGNFINIKDKNDSFFHIYFNDNKEEVMKTYINADDKVSKIKIIIDYGIKSLNKLFRNCICIKIINFIKFNISHINNMSYMFYGCSSLKELNLSHFSSKNVQGMIDMFGECSSLQYLNLSNLNTNKVNNMSWMFFGCSSIVELDLSHFNTDNVTNMRSMFSGCSLLTKLNVSNFNTNKVKDMSWMFCNCYNIHELDLSNFKTDNVNNMNRMFYKCWSLSKLIIPNFHINNRTNVRHIFNNIPPNEIDIPEETLKRIQGIDMN